MLCIHLVNKRLRETTSSQIIQRWRLKTLPQEEERSQQVLNKGGAGRGQQVTHQHVHVEDPAVLPRTDAEGPQVYATLVVEYPVQGVSDLGAKVITSSPFKFWGSIG